MQMTALDQRTVAYLEQRKFELQREEEQIQSAAVKASIRAAIAELQRDIARLRGEAA